MVAVDIGNTSLHFAWFRKDTLLKTFKLKVAEATLRNIRKILRGSSRERILVCSVVPRLTKLFKGAGLKVQVIGQDIRIPIKCLYDEKKVGADRLVGAYAAKILFPNARLILDFGTAVTLDFLSKSGAYQGGIILPGIGSTLDVFSRCAMLPQKISLKKVKCRIPKNTRESINKGLQDGFSLMINALVKKYKRLLKISPKTPVIITGGDAPFIIPCLDFTCHYEPLLVLKGLQIIEATYSSERP